MTEFRDCLSRENGVDFVRLYEVVLRVLEVKWPILIHHNSRLLKATTHVGLPLLRKMSRIDVYDVWLEERLEA